MGKYCEAGKDRKPRPIDLVQGAVRAMRNFIPAIILTVALAGSLGAQTKAAAKPPSGPAPTHDVTGVWMMRNPDPIRQYSNSTFSKGDPDMTDWAKEKFKT